MNTQKIALVTGANRGIGLEICKQLAQNGFQVILSARNAEKGKEAVNLDTIRYYQRLYGEAWIDLCERFVSRMDGMDTVEGGGGEGHWTKIVALATIELDHDMTAVGVSIDENAICGQGGTNIAKRSCAA